jgi:hypothetical protein
MPAQQRHLFEGLSYSAASAAKDLSMVHAAAVAVMLMWQ